MALAYVEEGFTPKSIDTDEDKIYWDYWEYQYYLARSLLWLPSEIYRYPFNRSRERPELCCRCVHRKRQ